MSAPQPRVQFNVAVGDGVTLGVDQEMAYVLFRVGDWYVELRDGNLTVRSIRADVTPLTVPALTEGRP